jgi:1,4-alpha-glucan branching enzyme
MIAEESTAFPSVTKPTYMGGLGFNFKWNMGWMNDMLSYMEKDPLFRREEHNKLTFSMCYAFAENFMLALSHDEVVHGKRSLIGKMPGSYEDKFASLRAFYCYMMAHPGKKLLFMGGEFGQFKEWNYTEGLEFFLTQYPMHKKLQSMVRDLNFFYLDHKPFYEIDDSWQGFTWLSVDDANASTIAFSRCDKEGQKIVSVINFSGAEWKNYYIFLEKGKYELVFNSDKISYGGKGSLKKRVFTTKKHEDGRYYISIDIPALSGLYLKKLS